MTFRARHVSHKRPGDLSMTAPATSVGSQTHGLEWTHHPGSCVPWKTRKHGYSVGVNFHGLYQAICSGAGWAKPVGTAWPTPEEAKAEAEKDWRGGAA